MFQIACNEAIFSREELYEMCRIAREMLTGDLCVGRVIARPFVGEKAGAFQRTSGRRDFSVEPFSRTLLDAVKDAGMASYGVGKIGCFASCAALSSEPPPGSRCIEAWLDDMRKPFDGLCFTNLVDTDMLYGHRRDPQVFADALAYFDSKLPVIIDLLGDEDLLVITADHGCDPTFKGTDHTRDHIPLLVYHKGMKGLTDLGVRKTYADIGATCAEWLGLPDRFGATSFMDKLKQGKKTKEQHAEEVRKREQLNRARGHRAKGVKGGTSSLFVCPLRSPEAAPLVGFGATPQLFHGRPVCQKRSTRAQAAKRPCQ